MLKIGLARADITPHAGIKMSGFGKRIQPSLGVNDPLCATALVAQDGPATLAIVDCDLLYFKGDFTAQVRRAAEARTGIVGGNIHVVCTHTHYGPEVNQLEAGPAPLSPRERMSATHPGAPTGEGGSPAPFSFPTYEHAYRAYLIHQIAGLIFEAQAALQPAVLRGAWGQCDIGINRRQKAADGRIILGENPAGAVDRSVGLCRIETPDGKPLAAVVSFASHPVGQDVQVRMISADYVGQMRRVVQEATGATCLFWQGAAGNINIRGAETDYAHVHAAGAKLGQEVVRLWQDAKPLGGDGVAIVSRAVEFPPFRCLSREHAEKMARSAEANLAAVRQDPKATPGLIQWLENDLKRLHNLRDSWTDPALVPPPVKADLFAARMGGLAWVCVPGELFNELGSQIKARSPFPHTFVVTYANESIGYLPTASAFTEGGYEPDQGCRVAPEAMPMLVDHYAAMLTEL